METPNAASRKLLPVFKGLWTRYAIEKFESVFILVTLVSIGAISYFVTDKLALLNFYFIPVLLAAYFLDTRSAVLGGVLSISWVLFFVVLKPDSFYMEPDKLGLYLHLVTWGSFLILCGALVGRLNEQLQEKIATLSGGLDDWKSAQMQLHVTNTHLQEKTAALEEMRGKLETALYSTMDPVVAQMILNKRLVNERKEITVLCSDLVDFASSAETLKPDAVVTELNRIFSQLDPVIAAYHGHHDKIIGDRLLAEFGIPRPSKRNALQAVLAGLKMQEKMSLRDHPWRMRVGIAHGDALVGLVGSAQRKSYTALGGVVNLAYKLQAVCPEGKVCVDEASHEEIKHWFETRRIYADRETAESAALKHRLKDLQDKMKAAGNVEILLEAAKISCSLGDTDQGVGYYRRAMLADPGCRAEAERSLAQAVLDHDAPPVKKNQVLRAFEVIGLKDPLADARRLPRAAQAYFQAMLKTQGLSRDLLLPIESLNGSIGHSQVTAALSYYLADSMGLADDLQQSASLAGFFHDVGLRNLPDELLNKPESEMTPQDLRDFRQHPGAARSALADMGIPLEEAALEAIEQHHEDFDGSGYPGGLTSDRISIIARIVRIADEYDALTSWRPDRDAWEPQAALAELKTRAALGGLDYKIVSHFVKVISADLPSSAS